MASSPGFVGATRGRSGICSKASPLSRIGCVVRGVVLLEGESLHRSVGFASGTCLCLSLFLIVMPTSCCSLVAPGDSQASPGSC